MKPLMVTKSDANRLYARIAGDIAAKIEAGEFDVGQRLPAERHLAQTYSVSRPTIREAILALELDGLVEVRTSSGVYVTARFPMEGDAVEADIGPFELLEARRAIEGEACALAAAHITDQELAELQDCVRRMSNEDVITSEAADRAFHIGIARATQNSAMVAAVEMLWEARGRSPQYRLLSEKAHHAGVTPRVEEHSLIVDALQARDSSRARSAMRAHLTKVLEAILKATEVHEFESAQARVAAQRKRYISAL